MTRYRIWKEPQRLHGTRPWRVALIPEHGPIRILHASSHADAVRITGLQDRVNKMFAHVAEVTAWAATATQDDFVLAAPAGGGA